MRNVRLICVTANNNNKFYNMTENGDDTFSVNYGRIDSTSRWTTYPMSKWDSIYRQKILKGYRDVTALRSEDTSIIPAKKSTDDLIGVLYKLQAYAKKVVNNNYIISSKSVTAGMINESQDVLNTIANMSAKYQRNPSSVSTYDFNMQLVKLFSILPRKMKKVQDHLLSQDLCLHDDIYRGMQIIINREQSMLDALSATTGISTNNENAEDDSLMTALGITLKPSDDELVKIVKKHLGEISDKFSRCWYCTNINADKMFQDHMANAKNKKVDLFWHGSKNENWLSILKNSLVIRPTGVATTGSMFGDGIYFASRAKKSFGYTSARGSYWARGDSDKAYMALFQVHTGKQYKVSKHTYECSRFSKSYLQNKGDYDSVYAIKGVDLYNDEFVIYDKAQCSIYALVELNG